MPSFHMVVVLLYLEPRRNDSGINEPNSSSDEKQSQVLPIMDFRDYGIGAQVLSALGLVS